MIDSGVESYGVVVVVCVANDETTIISRHLPQVERGGRRCLRVIHVTYASSGRFTCMTAQALMGLLPIVCQNWRTRDIRHEKESPKPDYASRLP